MQTPAAPLPGNDRRQLITICASFCLASFLSVLVISRAGGHRVRPTPCRFKELGADGKFEIAPAAVIHRVRARRSIARQKSKGSSGFVIRRHSDHMHAAMRASCITVLSPRFIP
jgi:hypothetical protein